MKRFLLLFISVVFLTVSCAGPNKVGWTRADFRHDEFEKDRKECSESIDKNLNSEAFGKALEECMGKKGYQYQNAEKAKEPPSAGMEDLYIPEAISFSPLAVGLWLLVVNGPRSIW